MQAFSPTVFLRILPHMLPRQFQENPNIIQSCPLFISSTQQASCIVIVCFMLSHFWNYSAWFGRRSCLGMVYTNMIPTYKLWMHLIVACAIFTCLQSDITQTLERELAGWRKFMFNPAVVDIYVHSPIHLCRAVSRKVWELRYICENYSYMSS